MKNRPGVELASLTDVGCKRENNEDSYAYWEPANDADFAELGRLAIVADGMGGHLAGEVASTTAVSTLRDEYYSPSSHTRIEPALRRAVQAANLRVHDLAHHHAEYRSMGTTLTSIALAGDCAYVAHVGDSRAYQWRSGELKLLTTDHSEAAELVRLRILKPDKVRDHPGRSVLPTRFASASARPAPYAC